MDFVIGSSRSNYLRKYLNALHPEPEFAYVYSRPGGKLIDLQHVAYQFIHDFQDMLDDYPMKRHHIYYVAGYCDITVVERDVDYEEVVVWDSYEEIFDKIRATIDRVSVNTLGMGAKPCFATIVPSEIETWNNYRMNRKRVTRHLLHHHQYDDMQYVLSNVVLRLNQYITEVNQRNGMVTPDLEAAIVEKRANRPARIHYGRLYDGVHPTLSTRRKWAKKALHAINCNRNYPPINMSEPTPSFSDIEENW